MVVQSVACLFGETKLFECLKTQITGTYFNEEDDFTPNQKVKLFVC